MLRPLERDESQQKDQVSAKIYPNQMQAQLLTAQNLDMLITFEQTARATEPDVFLSEFDEASFRAGTLDALGDHHYASARCLMCVEDSGLVVGRLDFALLPSFAFGGELRAYVDWVYVLKEFRHRGVARFMFDKVEAYLSGYGITEFFLIAAQNPEAQRLYHGLQSAEIKQQDVLTRGF